MMKTFTAKPQDIHRKWLLIDGENLVLGRLASHVAIILRGKHKPVYTPHMDMGDYVVIINAEKIALTAKKRENKIYYRHTGYPGGIKSRTAKEILEGAFPQRVLCKAIERMVPKGPLGRKQLKKLFVYAGDQHPHEAQKVEKYDFACKNIKNTARNEAGGTNIC